MNKKAIAGMLAFLMMFGSTSVFAVSAENAAYEDDLVSEDIYADADNYPDAVNYPDAENAVTDFEWEVIDDNRIMVTRLL